MKHSHFSGHSAIRLPATVASLTLALLLAACGGGGAGVGSITTSSSTSGTQTANGTVTGFGSVIVDGTEIEDATATVQSENADGSSTPVALKLGQHVRVAHDGKGTASQVAVDAAVIGSVSSLDAANSAFKVAGQWVKVNADSAAGPVTAFGGGYSTFADIAAADLVEVHGSPVYSSSRAAYEIQASRIEKKADIAAVRVMGKVSSLNSTTKTFALNGLVVSYASANVVPTSSTLANDQFVTIWGKAGSLSTSGSSVTLSATRVRVMRGAVSDIVSGSVAQLGGLVSQYSASAGTLELDGIKISTSTATAITPTGKTLANGSYIRVSGTFDATGVLAATEIHIRESSTTDDTARIKLSGVIGTLTDANSFVVRGVPVDATGVTLDASCTGVTLAEGVFVNVVANAQAGTDVVKATRIACVAATRLPAFAMREVKGLASAVDSTAKTFKVTAANATVVSVQWADTTVFNGVGADTLANATVKVEGYLNASGVLVAREIHVEGSADQDAYDASSSSDDKSRGWGKYKSRK